jgi:hypothetical protein
VSEVSSDTSSDTLLLQGKRRANGEREIRNWKEKSLILSEIGCIFALDLIFGLTLNRILRALNLDTRVSRALNWSTLKSGTTPDPLTSNSARRKGVPPPVDGKRGSRISLNLRWFYQLGTEVRHPKGAQDRASAETQ